MLFPQLYSFLLVSSFQFSFGSAFLSTHFVYCLPCYPRWSIFNRFSNLIDLICMYSVCALRYILANSFCTFLSFRALVLVGFFLLLLEAVFTSACFFLTANVSHGTLCLALWLVCILLLSGHWRNSHIRHSEYVFLYSPVVHRICFFVLTHIYLSYPCYQASTSHSIKWVLFGSYSYLDSVVFLPWQFGDRRTHTRKRNMTRNPMCYCSNSYL